MLFLLLYAIHEPRRALRRPCGASAAVASTRGPRCRPLPCTSTLGGGCRLTGCCEVGDCIDGVCVPCGEENDSCAGGRCCAQGLQCVQTGSGGEVCRPTVVPSDGECTVDGAPVSILEPGKWCGDPFEWKAFNSLDSIEQCESTYIRPQDADGTFSTTHVQRCAPFAQGNGKYKCSTGAFEPVPCGGASAAACGADGEQCGGANEDCCQSGLVCGPDGRCEVPPCGQQGEACGGLSNDCCADGLACMNEVCISPPPCGQQDEPCGGIGNDCCADGLVCASNKCLDASSTCVVGNKVFPVLPKGTTCSNLFQKSFTSQADRDHCEASSFRPSEAHNRIRHCRTVRIANGSFKCTNKPGLLVNCE